MVDEKIIEGLESACSSRGVMTEPLLTKQETITLNSKEAKANETNKVMGEGKKCSKVRRSK